MSSRCLLKRFKFKRRPSRFFLAAATCALGLCIALTPRVARAAFELDELSGFLPFFGADSLISSPADLSGRSCLRWQLGHQVPFGLGELSGHHLAVAISHPRWGLGAGLSLRGPGRHREMSTWLGAGLSPMPALAVGAGIHLLQLRQGDFPSVRAISLSAGMRLKLSSSARVSVWLRGPAGDLAQPRLVLSLSRILGDQSVVQGYLTRRGGRQRGSNRVHLGAAPPVTPGLSLLLGIRSAPIQFAAGSRFEAGVHFLEFRVDTHAVLGTSHTAVVGRGCGPSH